MGSLVARATLRPPAVLANGFDTLARILGPERLLVAIGAGDAQSREENETYGLDFGTVTDRVAALRDAVDATRATAATRCGSAAATPRCARSRLPTPTAGTAGAPGSSGSGPRPPTCVRPRPALRSR